MPIIGGSAVFTGQQAPAKFEEAKPVSKTVFAAKDGGAAFGSTALIRKHWETFDTDKSGQIEAPELKQMLLTLGLLKREEPDIDSLVKEELQRAEDYFRDGGRFNGKLSYSEFLIYYKKFILFCDKCRQRGHKMQIHELFADWRRDEAEHARRLVEEAMDRDLEMREIFRKHDADGDLLLDIDEITDMLKESDVYRAGMDVAGEINKAKLAAGLSGNVAARKPGTLDFAEFVHLYNTCIDNLKADAAIDRKAHKKAVREVMTGLKEKNAGKLVNALTDDVVIDEPSGWPAYGGVRGIEEFMNYVSKWATLDLGVLKYNPATLVECGHYHQESANGGERNVYLYRVDIELDNYKRVLDGQVTLGVEDGLNQVCEIVWFVLPPDDD